MPRNKRFFVSRYCFIALLIACLSPVLCVHVNAQEEYPVPVSEYAEKTGPGEMVFLSYPKYYRTAEDKLAPVETNLVALSDAEWDYEVTKGIWKLKVRNDGTFQAQHQGDIFTYRFDTLGIGRGNTFRPVDLGEPNFANIEVNGDKVVWNEVFPDVDISLRYIHDIMKVDVIVKEAFMNDVRAEINAGSLNPADYLTARFDIPNVFITSQPRQNGENRDIYEGPLELNGQPLYFERDGKTVHKLRPVETYLLDENGEPVRDMENPIRSSQRWNLKRDGGHGGNVSPPRRPRQFA